MLIPESDVIRILNQYSIKVTGILHVGAYECEEMEFYHKIGITPSNVIWLEANPIKVEDAKKRRIPNIYNVLIADKDNAQARFNISNNIKSSSMFEFTDTNTNLYSDIVYTEAFIGTSLTIDTFFNLTKNNIPKHNFWVLSINGAEYNALVGGEKCLAFVKAIYVTVGEKDLYKGSTSKSLLNYYLESQGFISVATETSKDLVWRDMLYIRLPYN